MKNIHCQPPWLRVEEGFRNNICHRQSFVQGVALRQRTLPAKTIAAWIVIRWLLAGEARSLLRSSGGPAVRGRPREVTALVRPLLPRERSWRRVLGISAPRYPVQGRETGVPQYPLRKREGPATRR